MVSTRGPKGRYFEKGEKVLCYEPDPKKAKVLYSSKILGVYENKDKRGRKVIQYKVHFQGWSSSWDRKVGADFLLRDTEENRQLQRDLAGRAQLQLGAYLYRKEHKRTQRSRNSIATSEDQDSADASASPTKLSEDNFSSGSTFERNEQDSMKDDCETDSCCSSVESFHADEDRCMLRISERLRQYLEYDYDMIVKYNKQHTLPSRIPVVAILENFVKQTALKMVFTNTHTDAAGGGTTRRCRTTQQRTDKKEKEFDKIVTTVGLLKEVADGLRIYFDFSISEYLLYKEEREYALSYLAEENLKNFTYIATPAFSLDWFRSDSAATTANETISPSPVLNVNTTTTTTTTTTAAHALAATDIKPDETTPLSIVNTAEVQHLNVADEQPKRRKLRSHRSDDFCDVTLENCLSSIASTSSGASTPLHSNIPASNLNYLKSLPPITPQTRDFLQNVLSWRLLPSNAMPAPSMIFGAPHLARLLVKLPEFLNASAMSDEKLKSLLQHLDTFTNFLESHKEWFNEDNYARTAIKKSNNNNNNSNINTESTNQLKTEEDISNNSRTEDTTTNMKSVTEEIMDITESTVPTTTTVAS